MHSRHTALFESSTAGVDGSVRRCMTTKIPALAAPVSLAQRLTLA
jgi:hypothetical protein